MESIREAKDSLASRIAYRLGVRDLDRDPAEAQEDAVMTYQPDRCSCCHRGLFLDAHTHPWDSTRG